MWTNLSLDQLDEIIAKSLRDEWGSASEMGLREARGLVASELKLKRPIDDALLTWVEEAVDAALAWRPEDLETVLVAS